MRTLMYVMYRVFNAIVFNLKRFERYGVVYTYKVCCKQNCTFYFDFTDPTTHLGDRLFFIPLIQHLLANSQRVVISQNDLATLRLTKRMVGVDLDFYNRNSGNVIKIIPFASYCRLKDKKGPLAVVDLNKCNNKPHIQLIRDFNSILNINDGGTVWSPNFEVIKAKCLSGDKPIIIFNNYIASGIFRKFFVDEDKLIAKCRHAKIFYDAIIYHVGSAQDSLLDKRTYDFVDVDLRGAVSPEAMIDIISSPQVICVVTYDNFIMHLAGIYGKKAFVLFRGRATKKARIKHYAYINNCFFDNDELISYI